MIGRIQSTARRPYKSWSPGSKNQRASVHGNLAHPQRFVATTSILSVTSMAVGDLAPFGFAVAFKGAWFSHKRSKREELQASLEQRAEGKRKNMKSSFFTSIGLVATLLFVSTTNAFATWKPQPLPGSGVNLPVVIAVGGCIGAAAILGIIHKRHVDKDPVHLPGVVHVGPDSATSFKLENHGSSPVQLAEVVLKGYSLVDAPALPVIIRANENLELRIRAAGIERRGTVALSILDGKHTRNRVIVIRSAGKSPASD